MASMILLFILSFPQKPEWTTGLNGKQSKKKSVPPYSILKYFLRLLFPIPYQATILDWVQKFTMVLVFFAAIWAGVTQAPPPPGATRVISLMTVEDTASKITLTIRV